MVPEVGGSNPLIHPFSKFRRIKRLRYLPAGKAVFRWNALRHGLRAETILLPDEHHRREGPRREPTILTGVGGIVVVIAANLDLGEVY